MGFIHCSKSLRGTYALKLAEVFWYARSKLLPLASDRKRSTMIRGIKTIASTTLTRVINANSFRSENRSHRDLTVLSNGFSQRDNGSDHRARTSDRPFQNHAQVGLRVHRIVICQLLGGKPGLNKCRAVVTELDSRAPALRVARV